MKKIFSNLFLIFLRPIKLLKKSRVDNFLGGLLIGALFSLVVNLVTFQIQEMVTKQRILESIEHEIFNNALNAKSEIERVNNIVNSDEMPNLFFTYSRFSKDLWSQGIEPLNYISQLPGDIQGEINIYYFFGVENVNSVISKIEHLSDLEFDIEKCYPIEGFTDSLIKAKCVGRAHGMLLAYSAQCESIQKWSHSILDKFHPTKDRLNNKVLMFLMGSDTVGGLGLNPKQ